MKRVALIGENSAEYIEKLLAIWNENNSVVLIDWRVPVAVAYEMLKEANVQVCYIEKQLADQYYAHNILNITIEPYSSNNRTSVLLNDNIYANFRSNYNRTEALVIYSSGTTGKSKGIILSHYAINTNADAIQDYMRLSSKDCLYIAKSLSHSSTLIGELLVGLKYKIPMVIAPTIVPPRYVLGNIAKFSVTTLALNPTLIKIYTDEIARKEYDLSSLKTIYVSGALFDDDIYIRSHMTFKNVNIYNVYGLSEAGPRVSAQRAHCCKNNSVGKPIKDVEIAIIDDCGNMVSQGERGLVHINTASRYTRYVSGNEKHSSLYKGWINTGDIGYIDNEGELHIVDRIDDLLIIDAHKIYPYDIERIIKREFDINDCMILKKKSESGDYLICFYTGESEINNMRPRLGKFLLPYEIPREFYHVSELPTNINGKKQRTPL